MCLERLMFFGATAKKKLWLHRVDMLWTIRIQCVYTLLLWEDNKQEDLRFIDVCRARRLRELSSNRQQFAQTGNWIILFLSDSYITSKWGFPWKKFIAWWGEIYQETEDARYQGRVLGSTYSKCGSELRLSDFKNCSVSAWQVPARRTKLSSEPRQNLIVEEQGSIENLR